jgi:hypothetical protein
MIISMPDVDPLRTAWTCYLYVDDADALYATRSEAVAPSAATGSRVEPPVTTEYRMREFAVVDCSGKLLRVGAPAA